MIVNNKINKLNKLTILTQFKYEYDSKGINSIKYNRFLGLKNKNLFESLPPPILLS